MELRETEKALAEIQTVLDSYSAFTDRFGAFADSIPFDHQAQESAGRILMTRARAAIERIAPRSTYAKDADRAWGFHGGVQSQLRVMIGALEALREDLVAGSLRSYRELLSANTFGDFLGMADELLSKGYKDAAAVIAGTVLEQHLRSLADKHGVGAMQGGRFKKADTLNAALVKKDVYGKTTQKSVTAYLGLRNDAAHGNYGDYQKSDVRSLIDRVGAFVQEYPA